MTVSPNSNPTNPYHISRAYGVQPPRVVVTRPVGSVSPVQPVERVRPAESAPKIDSGLGNVRRLIAAVVPGGVDFSSPGGEARPSTAATIPMYRHPADKNTAATHVQMGKALDISG